MTSSSLIDQWSEQLRETEVLLEQGSPHLRWFRLAYVRLYRFLLSFYGAVPIDQRDAGELESADPSGLMVDPSVDFRGKPARTGMQILKTLQSVAYAKDQIEAGPLQGGLQATDWIAVATAREVDLVGVRRTLEGIGIPARIEGSGPNAQVEVLYHYRVDARKVIDHWRGLKALQIEPKRPGVSISITVGAIALGSLLLYASISKFTLWILDPWIAHPLTGLLVALIAGVVIAFLAEPVNLSPAPPPRSAESPR